MRGVLCALGSIIQVAKIFFLISFAMFCPRLFLFYAARSHAHLNYHDPSFKLGLENITDVTKEYFMVNGHKPHFALITNQAGVDQRGKYALDVLQGASISVKKVIIPNGKHMRGSEAARCIKQVHGATVPIDYLYRSKHVVNDTLFDDVQGIIFDVPDISLSGNAYVCMVQDVLTLAAKKHKAMVILDRPNLFGAKIEGALSGRDVVIPFRSGMTVGELSMYLNKHVIGSKADIRVVPMCNYKRSDADQKELLECLSRMELPACLSSGGSFLGLMAQVAPFDVGLGTDRAFECLLLPESYPFEQQKWYELQIMLRNQGIESKSVRSFCAQKNEYMSGLRFNMQSMREFSTITTLLSVLTFFKDNGLDMQFSACFDAAVGTPLIREVVQGVRNHDELREAINNDLRVFFDKARDSFIYSPLPELLFI